MGSFDYEYFTTRLRSALLHAGIDPTGYSGHSFRRGAANTAALAGIDKKDIMDMGRWKSDAVNLYFSPSTMTKKLYHLSRRLQSPGPPTPSSTNRRIRFASPSVPPSN